MSTVIDEKKNKPIENPMDKNVQVKKTLKMIRATLYPNDLKKKKKKSCSEAELIEGSVTDASKRAWDTTNRVKTAYGHRNAYNLHKQAARSQYRFGNKEAGDRHEEQALFHFRNSQE